jgi:hypothetical protein
MHSFFSTTTTSSSPSEAMHAFFFVERGGVLFYEYGLDEFLSLLAILGRRVLEPRVACWWLFLIFDLFFEVCLTRTAFSSTVAKSRFAKAFLTVLGLSRDVCFR